MRLEPGAAEIDAGAVHWHALLLEQGALTPALCEAAIGADDAMPREVIVDCRQDESNKARGAWIDVAVGSDKPGWNGANAADDPLSPLVVFGHGQRMSPDTTFGEGQSKTLLKRPAAVGVKFASLTPKGGACVPQARLVGVHHSVSRLLAKKHDARRPRARLAFCEGVSGISRDTCQASRGTLLSCPSQISTT